jgi:N-acetyl-1-D-myo-inositol-2-amino-2-deoxy-alpha-D-glucopyranoside deacetylase
VILTFDPKGIYGHIDHIKVHRAATAAFWSAGSVTRAAPRRLFYTAVSTERLKAMQDVRENSPLSGLDPALYGVSDDSFAAVLHVQAYARHKEAAIRAHRSQTGPSSSFAGIPDEIWQQMFVRETFTLGGLRGGFPDAPVDDLFAGLQP